jgi:hypothetical protein
MSVCGAIEKYGIDSFYLYILKTLDFSDSSILDQRKIFISKKKENFCYNKFLPSYSIKKNLQSFS